MADLKTVGIKELKNNLSAYLREVRRGATVLVSDRNDIVAELHEPYGRLNISDAANPLLLAWAQDGILSLPACAKRPLEPSCVHLLENTARSLLDGGREESGE